MFFYDGNRCPVCERPFAEDDDIVACPQCGAPHHRTCWQEKGHCHFADQHEEGYRWVREEHLIKEPTPEVDEDIDEDDPVVAGTENSAANRRCARCGFANPFYADFCARCGAPLREDSAARAGYTGYGEYAPFRAVPTDPCGGVDPQTLIEDVPAEELAACVRINTAYYLPRFLRMARAGSRVHWNWAAFLFGPYWLLYRKNYLSGSIFLALTALTQVLSSVVYYGLLAPLYAQAGTLQELPEVLFHALQSGALSPRVVLLIYILAGVTGLVHLLCGLLGNRLYLHTCVSRVQRLKKQNPYGYRVFLPANGGVSILIGAMSYSAISLIQNLVAYFFI